MLQGSKIHTVTFTNFSKVINLLSLIGGDARALLACHVVASIDPFTADTAARHGIRGEVVPE